MHLGTALRTALRGRYLVLTAALLAAACGKDKPTITSFTAAPMTVAEGGTTTLSWNVKGADTIKISAEPGGQVVSTSNAMGSQASGAITANTTFTLSAVNSAGTVTRTVSVLVQKAGAPTVDAFTATPDSVESGGAVVLAWETTNATSVDIAPGVLAAGEPDGTVTVNPTANTTYTLTAKNADGMAMASVTVMIIGPQVLSFTANPQAVALGEDSVLSWNVSDATGVRITDGAGTEVFNGATLMGTMTVTPAVATPPGTVTYTLVATDDQSRMATESVTINVNPPNGPTVSFSANPTSIMLGQTSDLQWMVTNAVSVAISDGTSTTTTTADLTGTLTVMPLATTTYTLVATDANNVTAMAMATVTVMNGPPPIFEFTAAPNPIASGGTTTLSWRTVTADSLRILRGTTEIYTTADNMGTFDVTQTVTSTVYTLEATNALGTNMSNVTVYAHMAPVINTFTITPLSFTGNSTIATVTWDVTNVSTLSLLSDGVPVTGFPAVAVDPMVTDDSGTFDVNVSMTTVFTLVAQSAGGAASARLTVANLFSKMEPNDTASTAIPLAGDGGGVLGNINPAGDNDWYVVMVPAGGNLVAETSDGMGGCALDTRIRVYNSTVAVTAIADNDDIDYPANACSRVTPFPDPDVTSDADLGNMTAGLYYIRITTSSFAPNDVGPYALTVRVGTPACGNTLVEGGEQCDDGNTVSGDGCDGICAIESQGVVMGPMAPGTAPVIFTNSIVPQSDRDFYRVEMAGPGYIIAETFTGSLGTCSADTVLTLLDDNFVEIGNDDNDGPGSCSSINPEFDPWAFVQAGTYWLRVEEGGNNAQIASYGIAIRTVGQGCGNGILEVAAPLNEICDDGNSVSGDGCSATCTFEGVAETEPNDAFDAAGVLTVNTDTVFTGSEPAGDNDWYAITVPEGYHLDAYVTVNSFNSCPTSPRARLSLYGTNGTTLLASNVTAGPSGNCGRINPSVDIDAMSLAAGTYYLRVSEDSTPTVDMPSYYLHVRLLAPGCGNGVLDVSLNEQCDDGNAASGDGCDPTCHIEPVGVATLPTATPFVFAESIAPIGQHDFFQLTVTATTYVRARIYAPNQAAGCLAGNDTLIALDDANLVEIGRNDDIEGAANRCSWLNPRDGFTLVAPGTYYLEVWDYLDNSLIPAYELVVDSTPYLVCGNGAIEPGEECDDGNASSGDGCSAACTFEINATVINPPGGTAMVPLAAQGNFQFVQVNLTQDGQSITATAADTGGTACNVANTAIDLGDSAYNLIGSKLGGGPTGTAGTCAAIYFPQDAFATNLAAGTYFLVVSNEGTTGGTIQLDVGIHNPVCGDGVVNAGEQCDDGNTATGDGCGATCQFEGNVMPEVEPNDTLAQANSTGLTGIGTVTTIGTTNIPPVTNDFDYYSFVVPANTTVAVTAGTYTAVGDFDSCTNSVTDTYMTLRNAADVQLAANDDRVPGIYCSRITNYMITTGAAPETYYITIEGFSTTTQTHYYLDINVQ